jgi:hypothetical protein
VSLSALREWCERNPVLTGLGVGVLGGVIPMTGAMTIPGLVAMVVLQGFPFAWVTVALGWLAGLAATLGAVLVVALLRDPLGALSFGALYSLPYAIAGWLSLRIAAPPAGPLAGWWGRLRLWHLWMVMAGVLACVLGTWTGQWRTTLHTLQLQGMMPDAASASAMELVFRVFPGTTSLLWIFCASVNLGLAHQVVLFSGREPVCVMPVGPVEPERFWSWLWGGALLLVCLFPQGSDALWNALVVLAWPGLVKGSSMMVSLVRTWSVHRLALPLVCMLVVVMPWLLLPLTLLGFAAPWLPGPGTRP